jgi:hypothetical protein
VPVDVCAQAIKKAPLLHDVPVWQDVQSVAAAVVQHFEHGLSAGTLPPITCFISILANFFIVL